jgi:tetratricopeptide (TPR) repeat protein
VRRWQRDLDGALAGIAEARRTYEEMRDETALASSLALEAHVLQDLGKLADARAALERVVEVRAALHKQLLGSDNNMLGEVLLLQGDLAGAATRFQSTADDQNAAARGGGRLGMGRVRLEENKPRDALALFEQAAADLRKAGKNDDAALAEAFAARAQLDLGQPALARAAAGRAQELLAKSSSLLSRALVDLAAARAQAAGTPAERAQALEQIEAVVVRARQTGVVEDQLEAQLARAQLLSPRSRSHTELLAVVAAARAGGFALIAARASRAAAPVVAGAPAR